MSVIRLIQSQSKGYAIEGPDKLKIRLELPDAASRLRTANGLLALLTRAWSAWNAAGRGLHWWPTPGKMMNDHVTNKAPVMAGWLVLGAAWLLFLIPFPGLGLLGMVANLVAFILAIVVISKGETAHGIFQLACSIIVSPIVYFIGLALFVGILSTVEQR